MLCKNGQACAQDLRDRVLAMPGVLHEVADRFGVSQAYVCRGCAPAAHLRTTNFLCALNTRVSASIEFRPMGVRTITWIIWCDGLI